MAAFWLQRSFYYVSKQEQKRESHNWMERGQWDADREIIQTEIFGE